MVDDASGDEPWAEDPVDVADDSDDDPAAEGANPLAVVPWVLLSVAWLALTATKFAGLATTGAAAGVLFAVGGVATLLSTTAGQAVWFPNDVVTVVADVTILAALVLVLTLKTERGRDAVAG